MRCLTCLLSRLLGRLAFGLLSTGLLRCLAGSLTAPVAVPAPASPAPPPFTLLPSRRLPRSVLLRELLRRNPLSIGWWLLWRLRQRLWMLRCLL